MFAPTPLTIPFSILQIPGATKTVLKAYGEILFKAWSSAKGPYLQRIEYTCIQDLMNHAVHAPCKGLNSMAGKLKRILSAFHTQKAQAGVRITSCCLLAGGQHREKPSRA